CRNVHDGIDDLASSHENLAGTLHGVATEAGRLNSETLTVIAAIQTWLTVAAQAEVRRDPAETEALLHQGRFLFSELRRLLHEIERFTAEVAHRVSTDLRFVVRRATASTPVVRQARPVRASSSAGRRE